MKYTEKDIKEGTKLRCTNDKDFSHWTTGKVYTVQYGTMNNYVECDDGTQISITGMLSRLNKENRYDAEFEIIKEEEQMKYTENDLKEGTKLRCTQDGGCNWWTKGRIYTVANGCILDNEGAENGSYYLLYCMNDKDAKIKFEIFEYPTATITVDVEQRLNDKIEVLSVERQNIFDKMERMDRQEVKLRDKINKLKEAKKALEILKEFK